MAVPAASMILANAPKIIAGVSSGIEAGQQLYDIGRKYAPMAKRLYTNLTHRGGLKTAKKWMQDRFTTTKGLKKLISKDLPTVSKFIESGQLMKGVKEVAGDVSKGLSAVEKLPLPGRTREFVGSAHKSLGKATDTAQGYHDVLQKYNETGKNAIQQWKNKINPQ